MKNNKIVILSELAQELKIILKLKSTLLITRIKPPEPNTNSNEYFHSRLEFNLFDTSILKINTHEDDRIYLNDFMANKVTAEKYDYIVGDLPLGIRGLYRKQPFEFKIRDNWIFLYTLLKKLSSVGFGLFLVEPNFKQCTEGKLFIKKLAEEGYFLNAMFNVPIGSLLPMTNLRPVLALFSKIKYEQLFIAELNNDSDIKKILNNFKNKLNTEIIDFGQWVNHEEFEAFDNYNITQQINRLSTQYGEFSKYKLKEISVEINSTREKFEDKNNSIYISTIGKPHVWDSIDDLTLKHQNYVQAVLKDEVAKNSYLKLYFNTDLGRLTLDALKSGNIISKINKRSIEVLPVPIPSLQFQERISNTAKKLASLNKKISELNKELSLNPKNVDLIDEKIAGALELFDVLTDSDKIMSIVRQGESKNLEFKETFSKDITKNSKEKYIEDATLKNIVAFFNTNGGIVLIGVSDKGIIKGIENDFYISDDKYQLHFKDAIKSRIGEEWYPLIEYKIINVNGKKILFIECDKSDEPVYLDNKDFFVRSNPSTDKLEGPKLVDYIERHFKKNV